MIRTESPRNDDAGIEQAIISKGLTAPRVTPADIEANIVSESYFTAANGADGADLAAMRRHAPDKNITTRAFDDAGNLPNESGPLSLLTFCVLVLRNGFTVTGESACASPENFDAEIGRRIARENAKQKIWPLMGYALKNELQAHSF